MQNVGSGDVGLSNWAASASLIIIQLSPAGRGSGQSVRNGSRWRKMRGSIG